MSHPRLTIAGLLVVAAMCGGCGAAKTPTSTSDAASGSARQGERAAMVETQLAGRDIHDPAVLAGMRAVPRHEFVPEGWRREAYADHPLPIGYGQTISQPYIVALMTQLSAAKPGSRVLEVGTGSGYQAAVLAELGAEVFTIEIIPQLASRAAADLERLGYAERVHVRAGDGYVGWPEEQPFDAVVVTAAPERIPPPLKEQLKVGGRLVIPVGDRWQELIVVTRTADGFKERSVIPVMFVPMTGRAQEKPARP